MKTFILAGHDTTSSTIAYAYYLLSKHPEHLIKVRQEFDEVFGTRIEDTGDQIKKDPHIVNNLIFTTAIIKGQLFFKVMSTI